MTVAHPSSSAALPSRLLVPPNPNPLLSRPHLKLNRRSFALLSSPVFTLLLILPLVQYLRRVYSRTFVHHGLCRRGAHVRPPLSFERPEFRIANRSFAHSSTADPTLTEPATTATEEPTTAPDSSSAVESTTTSFDDASSTPAATSTEAPSPSETSSTDVEEPTTSSESTDASVEPTATSTVSSTDDSSSSTTEAPAPTEAPASTVADETTTTDSTTETVTSEEPAPTSCVLFLFHFRNLD